MLYHLILFYTHVYIYSHTDYFKIALEITVLCCSHSFDDTSSLSYIFHYICTVGKDDNVTDD